MEIDTFKGLSYVRITVGESHISRRYIIRSNVASQTYMIETLLDSCHAAIERKLFVL